MGMYDTVRVECPDCREIKEMQSKSGACILIDYELWEAPPDVLGGIHNESTTCNSCGCVFKIIVRADAKAVKIRP